LVENGFVMYGDDENDTVEVQDQDQNTEIEQLTRIVNKVTEVQEKNTEIVQSTSTINKVTEIQVVGQNTDGLQDVWNTTRPRPIDHRATEEFIKLVMSEDIQHLLKDKRTPKTKVWKQVYDKMILLGFRVCQSSIEGGIKCNQKWRNLEKNYIDFKKNAGPKSTGKGRKDPPPYYNLLHSAFAEKHTVKPPVVLDTLNISSLQN